jgi:hypothetical protein
LPHHTLKLVVEVFCGESPFLSVLFVVFHPLTPHLVLKVDQFLKPWFTHRVAHRNFERVFSQDEFDRAKANLDKERQERKKADNSRKSVGKSAVQSAKWVQTKSPATTWKGYETVSVRPHATMKRT